MADHDEEYGCPVTVTWSTAGTTTTEIIKEVLDVFIVLDESGSVGQANYRTAIDFVRNFIEDLDESATIFENGGNIAITEFSWNPTDMYGNSSESICEEYYNVPKCYGQRSAPGVDPKYWIPQTGVFALPNSYSISSDLASTLGVVDAMFYEPTGRVPQWPAYKLTCLGDAIKYTADMAQEAKNDPSREIAPDRQAIGGPHTGDVDDEDYVLDLKDFADLDDTFADELVSRISIACANNVEVTGVVATGVGTPTSLACAGTTCLVDDYTVTWLIDNLDASTRELTYVVDPCDCASVGGLVQTLASMGYTDDGNSPATIPTLPTNISVKVVDPTETCGDPSVNLASNGVWVDSDVNGYSNVGESITFTFIVSNSGTKTLHEFCVTDSKLGAGCLTCSSPVVPPGESFSCAITYHATQDDLDLGVVQSAAMVRAESYHAAGELVEAAVAASVQLPSLALLDVVNDGVWTDLDSDGFPDVKETVVYTIAIKNAGTVTLEEVEVVSTSGTVSCLDDQPVALLAAGDSYECATSHKLTQTEINLGSVVSTATATASAETAVNGVTRAATSTELLGQNPKINLEMTGVWQDEARSGNAGYADGLEVVVYTYTVTNAGNVDILGLSVTDPSVTLSCSPPLTTSPGDQYSCTGSYSLTWLEIIAGGTTATGTATGSIASSSGESISVSATADVVLKPPPSITLG
ncbi:unnamed protein product, partial [Pylaiella littoralis]